jgi:hypothetical protein
MNDEIFDRMVDVLAQAIYDVAADQLNKPS